MKTDRKLEILALICDEYIRTGEPIGSKAIAEKLDISSATVRNDFVGLTELGYLEQPHTSAGRVPTHQGFRLYINQLLRPKPLTAKEKKTIDDRLKQVNFAGQADLETALEVLSDVTGLAAVGEMNGQNFSVITKAEVIPAGHRMYVLLVVTSGGDAKNKVCRLEFDITDEQLSAFAEIVRHEIVGKDAAELDDETISKIALSLTGYMASLSPLLYAVRDIGGEFVNRSAKLSGETKLLAFPGVDGGELVNFVRHTDAIKGILENAFDNVNVLFGSEGDTFTVTNSSMLTRKYKGAALGVIGPMRIDYAKAIAYMDYFSKSIERMISDNMERNDDEQEEK
jgi:heat shock gene repressor HrcA